MSLQKYRLQYLNPVSTRIREGRARKIQNFVIVKCEGPLVLKQQGASQLVPSDNFLKIADFLVLKVLKLILFYPIFLQFQQKKLILHVFKIYEMLPKIFKTYRSLHLCMKQNRGTLRERVIPLEYYQGPFESILNFI